MHGRMSRSAQASVETLFLEIAVRSRDAVKDRPEPPKEQWRRNARRQRPAL
jgi:hypothetical protein